MGQLEDIRTAAQKAQPAAKPQAFGDFPVGFGHLFRHLVCLGKNQADKLG